LQRLESRVRQKQRQKGEDKLVVPTQWADFARLVQIRSGGDVKKFDPYPYQEKLVDLMIERSVAVVKSRQLGVSETIICFLLWNACLNPGYLGLVFSKTQADSSLLARRMKRMIGSLGLRTATENLSDIEILGHGRVLFRNSKPDSARGIESCVHCFMDELAFLDTAKEVYDAVAPAMQMVGDKARVFAVSTPNGKNGFFWNLLSSGNGDRDIELVCNQASKGDGEPFQYWIDSGGWAKLLIHWRAHPLYGGNPNFLQEVHEKQKLSLEIIEQEYNLSFQEAATNVFSADLVRSNATGEYESKPDKEARYFLGIDTSTDGKDFFVCAILKELDNLYSLVKLYRKRQETNEYHLYQVGQIIEQYKPTAIGIEVTGGVGSIYVQQLSKEFKALRIESIRTTGDSNPGMITALQLALEKRILKYPQNCLVVDELLSFRRVGRKLEASPGRYDDIVMALVFALITAESTVSQDFTNAKRIRLKQPED